MQLLPTIFLSPVILAGYVKGVHQGGAAEPPKILMLQTLEDDLLENSKA